MTLKLSNVQVSTSAAKGTVVGILSSSKLGDSGVQYTVTTGNDLFAIGGTPRINLITNWPTPVTIGIYSVSLVASKGGISDSGMFNILVAGLIPPPTLGVPQSIVLTPTSRSLQSNATSGTSLASVSVVMSDNSAFSGTLTSSDSIVSTVGRNLQLSRTLTASDVGMHNVNVTASQNGGSASAAFALTVTAVVALPIPSSITLTPASTTLQDNAVIGTQLCTVSVGMSDGSTFAGSLASNDALAAISGLSIKLSRGLSSSDDGLHNITITATQNGTSIGAVFALTVNAIPRPVSITLSPSALSLLDNAAAGTTLCTASVAMSDSSTFTGTLSANDSLVSFTGMTMKLARALTTADDGTHNITVTAT